MLRLDRDPPATLRGDLASNEHLLCVLLQQVRGGELEDAVVSQTDRVEIKLRDVYVVLSYDSQP